MHRSILCLAWTGLAAVAAAAPAAGVERSFPVRLLAPGAGVTLAAGATAELEWRPLSPFKRLPDAEEWEAFLSLDGGVTYPVRITPHLDLDLRRVRWQVPPLPTSDARLLLRFGDERRETVVKLPQRFAIAASPVTGRALLPTEPARVRGEPALPGGAGVVAWVEGSRRGGSLRQVVAAERPGWQARLDPGVARDEAAMLAGGQRPSPEPAREPAAGALIAHRGSPPANRGGSPLLAFDILLLTQRQNE
jgi:hypothetical protein